MPKPGEILFAANDFYMRPAGMSVAALQLSYDNEGRFPCEDGYATPQTQSRPGDFVA